MIKYDDAYTYEHDDIGYEILLVQYDADWTYDTADVAYGGTIWVGTIVDSTFVAELNRLANDGVYPARTAFLTATRAANVWAGTNGLTLIAALNYINDRNTTLLNMKPLQAVCNAIAGTTGKSSTDALRSIA